MRILEISPWNYCRTRDLTDIQGFHEPLRRVSIEFLSSRPCLLGKVDQNMLTTILSFPSAKASEIAVHTSGDTQCFDRIPVRETSRETGYDHIHSLWYNMGREDEPRSSMHKPFIYRILKKTLRWICWAVNGDVSFSHEWQAKNALHSPKLTWPIKMSFSNRNLLFQGSIFRGYVSFREGSYIVFTCVHNLVAVVPSKSNHNHRPWNSPVCLYHHWAPVTRHRNWDLSTM